jgi:dethiobiotin synthetase
LTSSAQALLPARRNTAVGGLFVTGTGTGVGKTVLSAALLAAMAAAGKPVNAHKPVVTGVDDQPGEWPPDHELLARVAGMSPEEVAPLRYGPAVSPHLAAKLAGERVDPEQIASAAGNALRSADARGAVLIVEGVGGLLVPLTESFTVRDLAARLNLPLLIAAAPGLGTINHTLLTLGAARAAGLDVRAVVLTPWPEQPTAIEESNRTTITRLGDVEVATLRRMHRAALTALTSAGAELPWRKWLPRERSIPSQT